jgi:hypothetical protein
MIGTDFGANMMRPPRRSTCAWVMCWSQNTNCSSFAGADMVRESCASSRVPLGSHLDGENRLTSGGHLRRLRSKVGHQTATTHPTAISSTSNCTPAGRVPTGPHRRYSPGGVVISGVAGIVKSQIDPLLTVATRTGMSQKHCQLDRSLLFSGIALLRFEAERQATRDSSFIYLHHVSADLPRHRTATHRSAGSLARVPRSRSWTPTLSGYFQHTEFNHH